MPRSRPIRALPTTRAASPTAPRSTPSSPEIFARAPREALGRRLAAAGIAFGNLNDVADFSRHPQLRRLAVPTPKGEITVPAPPALFAERAPSGGVPAIGEHSAEIRREFAE